MGPGAGRLDALDAELHERDAAARGDAHGDGHARHERAVGTGHVDTGSVHALDAHLHAPPERRHGFEHAAGDEQLGQLGQHGSGRGHVSHASPEYGGDKRQTRRAPRLPAGICAKRAPNATGARFHPHAAPAAIAAVSHRPLRLHLLGCTSPARSTRNPSGERVQMDTPLRPDLHIRDLVYPDSDGPLPSAAHSNAAGNPSDPTGRAFFARRGAGTPPARVSRP